MNLRTASLRMVKAQGSRPEHTRVAWPWIVLPGVLWLLIFLLLPLCFLVPVSLWHWTLHGMEHTWTIENYKAFLQPVYLRVLLKSIRIALTVTVVALVTGYPFAYWIAQGSPRRKALSLLLMLVPFWTSYIVRTFAWYPLLGSAGILNTVLMKIGFVSRPLEIFLFNEFAVQLGLLYIYLPYAVIPIFLSLDRLDRVLLEAAADLGAPPARQFWRITLPLSMPGVLAGSIITFVLCIGAFATPQLLGGPSGIMIGNTITEMFGAGLDWPLGAAASVLVMVVTLGWIWIVGRSVRVHQIFLGESY